MNVLLTTGRQLGAGLQFDGIDDFVDLLDLNTLNLLTDFTICGIIRADNRTLNQRIITNLSGTIGNARNLVCSLNITTNTIGFGIYTDSQFDDSSVVFANIPLTTVPSSQVFHVTLCKDTNDSNNWRFYVNAVEGTKSWVNASRIVTGNVTTANYRLGDTTIGSPLPFQGIMYDMKVFNKALTQAEVQYLYLRSNVIIPPTATSNVIANWRFNQKSGTTLLDRTGAWNGTLTNFTNTTPSVGNAWVDSNGNSITA